MVSHTFYSNEGQLEKQASRSHHRLSNARISPFPLPHRFGDLSRAVPKVITSGGHMTPQETTVLAAGTLSLPHPGPISL